MPVDEPTSPARSRNSTPNSGSVETWMRYVVAPVAGIHWISGFNGTPVRPFAGVTSVGGPGAGGGGGGGGAGGPEPGGSPCVVKISMLSVGLGTSFTTFGVAAETSAAATWAGVEVGCAWR